MQGRTRHPTDGELLLLDDPQALGGRRGRRIRQHVAECARCAARRSRFAEDLAEVASLWRAPATEEDTERREPGGGRVAPEREREHRVARTRLAAALDARETPDASGWPRVTPAVRTVLPAAAAGLVALVLVAAPQLLDVVGSDSARPSVAAPEELPAAPLRLLPDRRLTPGAVRPVTATEACRGDLQAVPRAGAGVPRQVFARYGIDYRRAAEYELDFLITPELGGAAEPGNLWPQPYGSTVWNAYVKDELERHLRRMVCGGALDLATAQRDIATDWIGAYRRYFDTSRPRRDYLRYPLTRRDGDALRSEAIELRLLPPRGAVVVADRSGSQPGIAVRMGGRLVEGPARARRETRRPGRSWPDEPWRRS